MAINHGRTFDGKNSGHARRPTGGRTGCRRTPQNARPDSRAGRAGTEHRQERATSAARTSRCRYENATWLLRPCELHRRNSIMLTTARLVFPIRSRISAPRFNGHSPNRRTRRSTSRSTTCGTRSNAWSASDPTVVTRQPLDGRGIRSGSPKVICRRFALAWTQCATRFERPRCSNLRITAPS